MPVKTKTPLRRDIQQYDGCYVTIKGRISAIDKKINKTCLVDLRINGMITYTDHLRVKLNHNYWKGDYIEFKAKIGKYKTRRGENYGVVEAKMFQDRYK